MSACILVVGNIRSLRDRIDHVRKMGFDVEWLNVDNDKAAPRRVDSVCARVDRLAYAAVVILEGFVAHRVTIAVEAACRRSGVPHAYGGRGGRREIEEALLDVARRMAA